MSIPMLLPLPAFTTAVAILVVLWILYKLSGQRKAATKSPPGPAPWPIIGNFLELGKFPHRSLEHIAKKYGPIISLKLGSVPIVVVSSPAMVKMVLKNQDSVFANRPQSNAAKYMAYNYKDVGLNTYGTYWRQMKKLCMVELFHERRLESFTPIVEEEIIVALRSMWEESQEGKTAVSLSKMMAAIIEAQVWRILSGGNSDEYHLYENAKEIKELVWEISHLSGVFNIGEFIPWLEWMDLQGLKRRMKKAHRSFDQFVSKILEKHNERGSSSIVHALMEMQANDDSISITAENVKAVLFDLFVAGVETTSTTLEWVMSLIIRNPAVAMKLQKEIVGVVGKERVVKKSDLESMEYLRCVVKEAMRLYPVLPLLLPHESIKDSIIDGYFIPKKSRILVNAWALGRDPNVWKHPLEFMPERFMGKDDDFVRAKEFFDMVPFGAGRRGCPGATMAFSMMTLTIAQLVHCFEWHVEGELDMTEIFGATTPRKHDLLAFPTLRLPMCP